MKYLYDIILISLMISITSCSYAQTRYAEGLPVAVDMVDYKVLGIQAEEKIIVVDTIDLDNKLCVLPDNTVLVMKRGYIKNGTLVGNNTRLKSSKTCFERVRILGSWIVPSINSSLFKDLSYDNALKDVLALTNPSMKNKVIIEKGLYQVSAQEKDNVCLQVTSNTTLEINGTIVIVPNNLKRYHIIQLFGDNISVKGNGEIIGDKHTHQGKDGEWGMGIDLKSANNVTISGLTIKDCWGDCIYVGGGSKDVKIEKCVIDHGRRQGISITSADRVLIRDCKISNIGGTNPEYAIDVEPNGGDVVDNVVIDNVIANNCKGGFLVYGKAPNARIGNVTIKNSALNRIEKTPILLQKCDSVIIDRCSLTNCKRKETIHSESVAFSKVRQVKRK